MKTSRINITSKKFVSVIKVNIIPFIYCIFLFFLIKIFSADKYEWLVDSGVFNNLCQLPVGGRLTTEPIIVLIPCFLILFLLKNKMIRYTYMLIVLIYLLWSFYLRFNWC